MEKMKFYPNERGIPAPTPPSSNRTNWLRLALFLCMAWLLGITASAQNCVVRFEEDLDTSVGTGKYMELVTLSNGDMAACGNLEDGQAFVTRFDSRMTILWTRNYQFGSGPTVLNDIVENSAGELVAVGACEGWSPGMPKTGFLLRLDANGAMLSPTPHFVSNAAGEITSIDLGLGGDGYIVVEHRPIPWFGESWVTKLADNFGVTWATKCDGYGQYTLLVDVLSAAGQGYFASGVTGSAFQDNRLSYWKLNANGGIEFEKQFVLDSLVDQPNVGYALAWDFITNTLLVGGTVYSDSLAKNDLCLLRVNPTTGQVLDSDISNIHGDDRIMELAFVPLVGIYAGGYTGGGFWFGLTESDATLMMYDDNLGMYSIERWEDSTLVGDSWVIEGLAMNLIYSGEYAWAGYRTGVKNGKMYYTSCGIVGIDEGFVPTPFSLFPNPLATGSHLTLAFEHPLDTPGRIEVYALDGKLITQSSLHAGAMSVVVAAPDVAGMYLVRLSSEKGTTSKRIVVSRP